MILDICDIINKHKGKSALVIGNGPSLTPEIKKNLHNLNPESSPCSAAARRATRETG